MKTRTATGTGVLLRLRCLLPTLLCQIRLTALACSALLFSLAGCSDDQQKALVDAAKKASEQTSEAVGNAAEKTKQGAADLAKGAGELADGAKQAAESAVQSAAETASNVMEQAPDALKGAASGLAEVVAPTPGEATISVDETYIFSGAFIGLMKVPASPGESARQVLQVKSYKGSEEESYPSFFFQAKVEADSLSSLEGSKVEGDLFVLPSRDSSVWFCDSGTSVTIELESLDPSGNWKGKLTQGRLSSTSGPNMQVRGNFSAVELTVADPGLSASKVQASKVQATTTRSAGIDPGRLVAQ